MADGAGHRWHLVLPCYRISDGKARRLDGQRHKVQKYYIYLSARLQFHLDKLFSPHSLKKNSNLPGLIFNSTLDNSRIQGENIRLFFFYQNTEAYRDHIPLLFLLFHLVPRLQQMLSFHLCSCSKRSSVLKIYSLSHGGRKQRKYFLYFSKLCFLHSDQLFSESSIIIQAKILPTLQLNLFLYPICRMYFGTDFSM